MMLPRPETFITANTAWRGATRLGSMPARSALSRPRTGPGPAETRRCPS